MKGDNTMSKGVRSKFYADIMAFHPEVTGSCNLVVVRFPDGSRTKFLVDCGLFQENKYNANNRKLLFNPEEIDFVLVTHNHIDHTGRLPYLVKNGFKNNIYMTSITKELIDLALEDSCHVLEDLAKRENLPPLYSMKDVKRTTEKIIGCNYRNEIQVTPNIKVNFLMNGHLLGAAVIWVTISYPECNDINLMFTGDYNNKNMFFDVDALPVNVIDVPLIVIQEATYGYMDSDEITKGFYEENVIKAIEEGKTIISPVFSLGRAQEILYIIKTMQKENRLSKHVPVYFDGKLAIKYNQLYCENKDFIKKDMQDFFPENLTIVDNQTRPSIIQDRRSKIIITTSGMGTYGPAQTYIPEYLPRRKTLIHFTGYTAEGSLGHKLKVAQQGEIINVQGLLLMKRADIEYTNEYSAHAKADEMLDFLKQFSNLRMVLINHGKLDTKETFATRVLKEIDVKNVGILGNGYLFRVDAYGLIKTMGTKFE